MCIFRRISKEPNTTPYLGGSYLYVMIGGTCCCVFVGGAHTRGWTSQLSGDHDRYAGSSKALQKWERGLLRVLGFVPALTNQFRAASSRANHLVYSRFKIYSFCIGNGGGAADGSPLFRRCVAAWFTHSTVLILFTDRSRPAKT